MTLKVYLSGSSKELGRAFHWDHALRHDESIVVTSTWLTRSPEQWAGCDMELSCDERLRIAREEIREIRRSDVLWLLIPAVPSFGAAFEFAVAALHAGIRAIVSGEHRKDSVFTELAGTDLYADDSVAFGVIAELAAATMDDARGYVP